MMPQDPQSPTEHERGRVELAQQLAGQGDQGVQGLIAMLTDPSWVVRRAVVAALASAGSRAAEPLCEVLRYRRDNEARIAAAVDALATSSAPVESAVIGLVDDDDPAVVADAAQVLGRRREDTAVPALVKLTEHPDDNVAVAAIEALGRVGNRHAVAALISTVGGGNFFRTFPAIDVLGRSGDPRAVEPLAAHLSNPSFLTEAARALGRTGERAAATPLLELLAARSDAVVRVAALALSELRTRFEDKSGGSQDIHQIFRAGVPAEGVRRLIRALADADVRESVAVCTLLGAIGNAEAAPVLTAKLDSVPLVAQAAAQALLRIGKESDAHLQQAIREGDSNRRKLLLPMMVRTTQDVDLSECLEDPDPEVRALACEAAARLGYTPAVPALFQRLTDNNVRVVHSAVAAIQALGTREARTLAMDATRSPRASVRRSALRILAYYGDADALPCFLAALEDDDPRVREASLQGLPYLEDTRAVEALFEAARSSESRTRAFAVRSLGLVPNANERTYAFLLRGLSDDDAWVRYYACQSLGRLGYAPAATRLSERVSDTAGQVRVAAVEALSHISSPEAHGALRNAAASEEPDVKRAALIGLGMKQRSEDLALLLSAAQGRDVPTRLVALSAIAGYVSPAVLPVLASAACDPDEQVSTAAVQFLAARTEREATEVLVDLLKVEPRERAKAALAVPSEGRLAGLLAALDKASEETAPLLTSIIARLDPQPRMPTLLAAMGLGNAAARKAAAITLAARRNREVLAALREAAVHDPDPEVRHICTLLLSE